MLIGLIDWTVFYHMLITHCVSGSQRLSKCRDRHKACIVCGSSRQWGPNNKSADVETDEQREDRLQLTHDRGNDNMVLRLINTAQ